MGNFHYVATKNKDYIYVIDVETFKYRVVHVKNIMELNSDECFACNTLTYTGDIKSVIDGTGTFICKDSKLRMYWLASTNKANKPCIRLIPFEDKHFVDGKFVDNPGRYTCNKSFNNIIDIWTVLNDPYTEAKKQGIQDIYKLNKAVKITIDKILEEYKTSEGCDLETEEQQKIVEKATKNQNQTTKNNEVEQEKGSNIKDKNSNATSKPIGNQSEIQNGAYSEKNLKFDSINEQSSLEVTLRNREVSILKREESLKSRELNVENREKALKDKEDKLKEKERALVDLEQALLDREQVLKSREQTGDNESLANLKLTLDKKEQTIKLKENEQLEKEIQLREKEKLLKEAMCKMENVGAYTLSEIVLHAKNVFTLEESPVLGRNIYNVLPNYTYELIIKSLSNGDIISIPKAYIDEICSTRLRYIETLHDIQGYATLEQIKFDNNLQESIIAVLEYRDNSDDARMYICREYGINNLTDDDVIIYTTGYIDMRKGLITSKEA